MPNRKQDKRGQRQKGIKLLEKGFALGDTCNRTRKLNERSCFAATSSKHSFNVLFKASEKKKVFEKLTLKYSKSDTEAIMHCTKIYYALYHNLGLIPGCYICAEGYNPKLLRRFLKQLFGERYDASKLIIKTSLKPMFTKKNIAHKAALNVVKKGHEPTMVLKEQDFKRLKLIK